MQVVEKMGEESNLTSLSQEIPIKEIEWSEDSPLPSLAVRKRVFSIEGTEVRVYYVELPHLHFYLVTRYTDGIPREFEELWGMGYTDIAALSNAADNWDEFERSSPDPRPNIFEAILRKFYDGEYW